MSVCVCVVRVCRGAWRMRVLVSQLRYCPSGAGQFRIAWLPRSSAAPERRLPALLSTVQAWARAARLAPRAARC